MNVKIGAVGLAEAGNLGDDLIMLSVLDSLGRSGVRDVAYLSHDCPLDLDEMRARFTLPERIERRHPGKDLPLTNREATLFADRDGIVFGGGGLLQDVHHPHRPYQWLRYVPSGKPTIAVGLGLGPLSKAWRRALATMPRTIGEVFVRDDESQALGREMGWECHRSKDCVSPRVLDALVGPPTSLERVLGVAVRSWPGLDSEALARHIDAVAARVKCERVEAFVLEAKNGQGVDCAFTADVLRQVRTPHGVKVYDPREIPAFMQAMAQCTAAVSMKLHSSVIWDHLGVDIFPIHYAPKTAALFGHPYRGLEILDTAASVHHPQDDAPSTDAVIQAWVDELQGRPRGQGYPPRQRRLDQLRAFGETLRRRIKRGR